jgi:predicted amidohydrolase YtcJ
MNYADIPHYVELAKRNGSWLTSTLLLNERILAQTRDISMLGELPGIQYLHPVARPLWFDLNRYASRKSPERIAHLERQVEFTRRLTKAFVDAGVPVVAGTDTPLPGLVPGFALHGELEALARAGLTNVQILAATTRLPAEWLGVLDDRGTVEAGKRADLLLLDADPTVDIANTHKIAAVIVGGHYLSRKELDRMLATVAEHYAEMPVFKPKPYGSDGPKR